MAKSKGKKIVTSKLKSSLRNKKRVGAAAPRNKTGKTPLMKKTGIKNKKTAKARPVAKKKKPSVASTKSKTTSSKKTAVKQKKAANTKTAIKKKPVAAKTNNKKIALSSAKKSTASKISSSKNVFKAVSKPATVKIPPRNSFQQSTAANVSSEADIRLFATPRKEEKRPMTRSKSANLGTMGIPPYRERKGEFYMSNEQLKHFREILMRWKSELMQGVDSTIHHMQDDAANFPDPNDRATQEEEFSLELRARDRDRKLVKKIEEALEKIESEEYGFCDECGIEIGIRRLEARPTATLCIDCKTLDEIKEKQMGG